METDLRMALGDAIASAVDDQVLVGDGGSPNLSGLLKIATDVAADGTTFTWANTIDKLAGMVDGEHAYSLSDLRVLVGAATFAAYAGLFRDGSESSLWDYLSSRLGSLAVSERLPAKASNAQKGLVTLTGSRQPIQVFRWSEMRLLADPFTKAGQAIRVITAWTMISDPHAPYTTSQVKEIHPKIS